MSDFKYHFYRVKVGNMYYVEGSNQETLPKINATNRFKHFMFEPNPDIAFLFQVERAAYEIAELVGGVVEHHYLNTKEYDYFYALRELYIDQKYAAKANPKLAIC